MSPQGWVETIPLSDINRREQTFVLTAGREVCEHIAKRLGLVGLSRFEATTHLSAWLDGAQLKAVWSADLVQACCVTLEDLPVTLSGRFEIRLLPPESPNAPHTHAEVVIDPMAQDPPDVLSSDSVPLADYLIEHLALELDPFPRKPGAVFVAPPEPAVVTPFSALKALQTRQSPGDVEE